MARITYVAKAQPSKFARVCYSCREPIEVGQAYNWTKPSRYSSKYVWHAGHAAPPGSVLETNDKRSQAMAAFENAYAALDEFEFDAEGDPAGDLEAIVSEAAEGVQEAAEMWREGAQAIEDGFGHPTYQSDEMNDHADVYEGVAQAIESIYVAPFDAEHDTPEEWVEEHVEGVRSELSNVEGDLD